MAGTPDVGQWRSVITLIVFLLTNVAVIFPFSIPVPIPPPVIQQFSHWLVAARILPQPPALTEQGDNAKNRIFKPVIPINLIVAPLLADLFLLAIQCIGRKEVHDGILGADGIVPIDIMAFFLALAYLAISLDATGLIRFLAFLVLKKGGRVGHRLYFLLYAFFFSLGTFIGNDPIILSGTSFLAYLARGASNIIHPRAWIHAQFAIANISSAILVSSNPTNLVLAGAFKLSFVSYTLNMIVPVVATAIVLFPFLLYIIFPSKDLIPLSINLRTLSEEAEQSAYPGPTNNTQTNGAQLDRILADREVRNQLPLSDILNPYLDKKGAIFGSILFAVTLAVLLATNATGIKIGVYAITVPAAFVMFCRDIIHDWGRRHKTRGLVQQQREQDERTQRQHANEAHANAIMIGEEHSSPVPALGDTLSGTEKKDLVSSHPMMQQMRDEVVEGVVQIQMPDQAHPVNSPISTAYPSPQPLLPLHPAPIIGYGGSVAATMSVKPRSSLSNILHSAALYLKETFPTVWTVIGHLPFPLVPFAFSMFILVQGLVSKGWVELFARGWAAWVHATGVVGVVAGMGFVSVCLSNFAGTNIGASILLSRVLQQWLLVHTPSQRTHDAAIYALALGVNYGAFSAAFSASLAGLLWRDILAQKYVHIRALDFARVNLPIIAIAMTVGCSVLIGQVFIIKDGTVPHCVNKGRAKADGLCP